jgi:hypothetical protein
LIVPSSDPDTILVPSGENATDRMVSLWVFVFSATQLMSIAIILRTKETCVIGSMEICGTTSGCKLEGRLKGLDAGMQQPTACRKYEGDRVCGVWL